MSGNWWWFLIGIGLIGAGVLALANPFDASLAVELMLGWIFTISGTLQLIGAFGGPAGARVSAAIWGLLALFVGVSLLANPLGGLVSLTVLLGVLLVVSGLIRLVLAWGLRQSNMFWSLLLSGAFSVLLGGMIFADVMSAATQLLGIFLAVELIISGIGAIAMGTLLNRS